MDRFIKNLARGAGAILRAGFRTKFKTSQKSASYDIVTEFDHASESYIINKIRKAYPSHGILSEESGHIIKKNSFWIIDPLDGTSPFSRGLAGFSVCIAFVRGRKIEFGAVYDPMADELFFAKNRKGATLNGRRIYVHDRKDLRFGGVSLGLESGLTSKKEKMAIYEMIADYDIWPLAVGSCAICMCNVACGRYDAFVSKYLSPWDYAAGAIIMKEAGARVTDFRGRPYHWKFDQMIAANPALHKEVIAALK